MSVLTPQFALEKREQLIRDGFCVIPGILQGSLLERWRAFSDEWLDRTPVDQKYRYQGSDFHISSERRFRSKRMTHPETDPWSPLVDELVDLPAAAEVCELMGFEGREADDTVLILSKPAHGPALYWHQDFMEWNHPKACTPWPTRIFLSYYTVDTTRENGCLRAIPGSHLKRLPLHDLLPAAHGPEIQAATDDHPAFLDHPDAVDLPVKAGDLVINDARLLHAAYPNSTDTRRTLLLQWHSLFPYPNVPSWWKGPVPEAYYDYDPKAVYEPSRIPGKYLADFNS
ncbi:MAG: phytanoyl-CoA dioxygenase family protein [Candidatus Hydrogenedentes bacterium]|nr:phytanoyl-CoA dioxygenase family protein [Candidatus Hydrogenedentota bacterium]